MTANHKKPWTTEDVAWLIENYPALGKTACASYLQRSVPSVRQKASDLHLKVRTDSEFFQEFQRRAAASKVGKKRPEQAKVILALHAAGRLKRSPESLVECGKRQSQWIKDHGHPRGALGMKHTPESLKKISEASKMAWKRMTPERKLARTIKSAKTRDQNGTYVRNTRRGTWRAEWREIGGVRSYFRSRWEANYARFLEWLKSRGVIAKWEHEPETFWFENVKRGCVSYLPDFRVTNLDGSVEYHEVKGWMDDRSKTKIRRMAKYHPEVKLLVIAAKEYRQLEASLSSTIPYWEF